MLVQEVALPKTSYRALQFDVPPALTGMTMSLAVTSAAGNATLFAALRQGHLPSLSATQTAHTSAGMLQTQLDVTSGGPRQVEHALQMVCAWC